MVRGNFLSQHFNVFKAPAFRLDACVCMLTCGKPTCWQAGRQWNDAVVG